MFRLGYAWRLVAVGLLNRLNENGRRQLWAKAVNPATGERYGWED